MAGYVYIVTNQKKGTLYIGVTSDLARRIYEHREGLMPGFTSKIRVRPVGLRTKSPFRSALQSSVRNL